MEKRVLIKEIEPESYKGFMKTEKYLTDCNLDIKIKELIKIRVSQINGCAYCIELHTKAALLHGESEERIFALSAWRESMRFSEKEKAVLQMAEEITYINQGGVSSKTYSSLSTYYSEPEIARIIVQIAQINLWNRIAVSTHMV